MEGQACAFAKISVYKRTLLRCLKTSVEVAGIRLVGVETNKGTAADFCVSASQAESSCSQINSGDVGVTVS